MLKEFYSHGTKHPHGWGMAYKEGDHISIEKEPANANKSTYLHERLKGKLVSQIVLAHIRYATIGNIEYENCHPFSKSGRSGRTWTLIHNGTIFDYEPLKRYIYSQEGETDSERILMHLVDTLDEAASNKGATLDAAERSDIVNSMVCTMSKGNKLNLILYDGELMYVHTNYNDSLYFCQYESKVIFSTVPLQEGCWEPVPSTQLLAYRQGEKIYAGSSHGNVYTENDEDTKMLYQIYSGL
jgi:Predicted glutamine amidotransferase